MQYTWFYPVIPESSLVVNKNRVMAFRSIEAIRDQIPARLAPQMEVPAWRMSQIGLTTEATYTSSLNPAIFLANQAPHLLQLAHYTKDYFLGRSSGWGEGSIGEPVFELHRFYPLILSNVFIWLEAYNDKVKMPRYPIVYPGKKNGKSKPIPFIRINFLCHWKPKMKK